MGRLIRTVQVSDRRVSGEQFDLQANDNGKRVDSDREMLNSDVYGTPHSSPIRPHKFLRPPELAGVDDDDDDDDDYYSLDDDDGSEASDADAIGTFADEVMEEMERRRVFEAAGVIVSDSKRDEYSMDGSRLGGRRRARRPSTGATSSPKGPLDVSLPQTSPGHHFHKDLPPVPTIELPQHSRSSSAHLTDNNLLLTSEMSGARRRPKPLENVSETNATSCVDDAFERYETFKKMHGMSSLAANRMSASSFDTSSLTMSSPPRSPAVSLTPSLRDREHDRTGENRTSHFLSFLGRHTRPGTPDIDRERKIPVISWPIHGPSSSVCGAGAGAAHGSTREGSPAFGTSWASLLDRTALEEIPKVERKRQEAIFELISTEADYVRDLQLIVEVCIGTAISLVVVDGEPYPALLLSFDRHARRELDVCHFCKYRRYPTHEYGELDCPLHVDSYSSLLGVPLLARGATTRLQAVHRPHRRFAGHPHA